MDTARIREGIRKMRFSTLAFFEGLPHKDREQVCFLACRLQNAEGEVRQRPMTFTDSAIAAIEGERSYARCDYFIWTGSLFRMPAVARIGLPSADYVLDVAEVEYGYRARRLGFASYVVNSAVTHGRRSRPRRRRNPNMEFRALQDGLSGSLRHTDILRFSQSAPFLAVSMSTAQPKGILHGVVNVLLFPTNFFLEPVSHRRQLIAYLRVWDGLTGHIERRY